MKKNPFIMKNNYLKLISNNYVIIENYGEITNISSYEVISTNYTVKGEELIVKKVDGYYLEIAGKITCIIVN